MRLNDYFLKFSDDTEFRNKSRFLIIPNHQEKEQFLQNLREQQNLEKIRLSDFVNRNDLFPAPPKIFLDLKEKIKKINQKGNLAYIVGLDAILRLCSIQTQKPAYSALCTMLDQSDLHFLIFSREYTENAREIFKHPRYEGNQIVLLLGEDSSSEDTLEKVRLIAKEFQYDPIPGRPLNDLSSFLREYEDGLLTAQTANIYVDFQGKPFAGINENCEQIYSRMQFLKHFCGLDEELSDEAVNLLYSRLHEKPEKALNYVQRSSFPEGLSNALIHAPERIIKDTAAEREILIWMLKNTLQEDSYLYHVLFDKNFSSDHFMEFYVCEALNLLGDSRKQKFIEERRKALQNIGTNAISGELTGFIKKSRTYAIEAIVPWMNLQTNMEKHELLRRYMESKMVEIPHEILSVYPQLQAYMSPYKTGLVELNQYFTEYRKQKILNTITSDFYERAKTFQPSLPRILSRDNLLKKYANDSETVLLIADCLGAEYLPMILALAQKRNLGILSAEVAFSRFPTSTEFNQIQWPEDRRLPDIKALDNDVHHGPEPHSLKPFEENFASLLETIDTKIISEIANNMMRYSQIILTSDHGATRLAISAYKLGLAQTIQLPENSEITDWRYTKVIPGYEGNPNLMENLSGTHLIVKGYDNLAKRPKVHETHGGATYEESLVPFVVFKQGSVFVPTAQQTQENAEEFVENKDFDL